MTSVSTPLAILAVRGRSLIAGAWFGVRGIGKGVDGDSLVSQLVDQLLVCCRRCAELPVLRVLIGLMRCHICTPFNVAVPKCRDIYPLLTSINRPLLELRGSTLQPPGDKNGYASAAFFSSVGFGNGRTPASARASFNLANVLPA